MNVDGRRIRGLQTAGSSWPRASSYMCLWSGSSSLGKEAMQVSVPVPSILEHFM